LLSAERCPDEPLTMIDEQSDIELDAGQLRCWQRVDALGRAARATAIASMRSDLPRSRALCRAPAINRVATRTTRSPRAIRKPLEDPDTCLQSFQGPHALARQATPPSSSKGRRTLEHPPRPSCRPAIRRSLR